MPHYHDDSLAQREAVTFVKSRSPKNRKLNIPVVYAGLSCLDGGLFETWGETVGGILFAKAVGGGLFKTAPLLELKRLVTLPGCDPVPFIDQAVSRIEKGDLAKVIITYPDEDQINVFEGAGWWYSGFRQQKNDYISIDGVPIYRKTLNTRHGTSSFAAIKKEYSDKKVERFTSEGRHLYYTTLKGDVGIRWARELNLPPKE